jgi:hypothetical protein
MIWLLFSALPPPASRHLNRRHTGRLRKIDNLLGCDGRGEAREGEGAKSYDGEKAWYSTIHELLSACFVW